MASLAERRKRAEDVGRGVVEVETSWAEVMVGA